MPLTDQEEYELLALEKEKSQFGSTAGGAAVGNPSIQRQGQQALRPDVSGRSPAEALTEIGGAGAIGAGMGAMAPEIAQGLGRGLSAIPNPVAKYLGAGLELSVPALRNAGRVAGAISGGISGLASETAGQAVEATGAPQVVAEGARLAAGGGAGEAAYLAKEVLKKYALLPALGLAAKFKHEAAKKLLERIERGSMSLADQERELVASIESEIRGGAKSDAPLEKVGSIMGDEGQRLLSEGERQKAAALLQAGRVGNASGYPGRSVELADIGGSLQTTINTRHEGALKARSSAYKANELARDDVISRKEKALEYISDMPEYKEIVRGIKAELKPGLHIPDIESDFAHLLNQLSTKAKTKELPFGGMGSDPFSIVTEKKPPVTFQQIDELRRKLGEVFRGKPPEGYKSIDADTARKYYEKLSTLQKEYAGPAQQSLLDKYAEDTVGLELFSSKFGKKATSLDQYREGQYANDPSSLPSQFFKTRASVDALHELVGNKTQVNAAALAYADRELEGKSAAEVRLWMGKNSEWLSETGVTHTLIDKYATRLQSAERSMRVAEDFSKQAAKNSDMLIGKSLPAQRAVDLIKSGDTELWGIVAPVIAKSPQAKTQMVSAARQVIADQATAKGTADLFSRNIRPFLEGSNIATKAEMDAVASGIERINNIKLSEPERLGRIKRLVLQSIGGFSAATSARAGVGGYGLLSDQIPQ